ncbi:polysialyltransferase family glycosyltransferase, partial [Enterovibrio norvegicus]|uniref:polysialyltransferase family glycosyltransferase n=1 Tax=Enterovibrio norvegicus TaxID=188144 RepID=UPI003552FF62
MNLFLISQFGQLIHHQALIKRDGLKNNKLVILYTIANTEVPRKIELEADKGIFDEIILAELPLRPNSVNLENINKMTEMYSQLLGGVSNLYMSSFESHYNICHKIAMNRSIRTHLIEEGLATYKYSYSKFKSPRPKESDSLAKALNDSGLSSNRYYPFAKLAYVSLRNFCGYIRDIYIFPIQIFKTLSYKKTSEYNVFNHIKNLSDERNAFID